jgi:hypothetical protein
MTPARSSVIDRASRNTSHKRGVQVGLVKTIQHVLGRQYISGDWLHTAGPGNVAISYYLYERILSKRSTYTAIEYFEDLASSMVKEASYLRKQLNRQQTRHGLQILHGEFFRTATRQAKAGRNFSVIDADFCVGLRRLADDGMLYNLTELLKVQREKNRSFFFILTFSTRCSNNKDTDVLNEIDSIMEKFHGEPVDYHSYRDGAPMVSIMWHVKNKKRNFAQDAFQTFNL